MGQKDVDVDDRKQMTQRYITRGMKKGKKAAHRGMQILDFIMGSFLYHQLSGYYFVELIDLPLEGQAGEDQRQVVEAEETDPFLSSKHLSFQIKNLHFHLRMCTMHPHNHLQVTMLWHIQAFNSVDQVPSNLSPERSQNKRETTLMNFFQQPAQLFPYPIPVIMHCQEIFLHHQRIVQRHRRTAQLHQCISLHHQNTAQNHHHIAIAIADHRQHIAQQCLIIPQ